MKKEKILVILGPEKQAVYNHQEGCFTDCLDDRYDVEVPQIDYLQANSAQQSINRLALSHEYDYIIGVGFGCFFVHQLDGYDRICINPVLSVLECNELSSLPDAAIDEYLSLEKYQFSYGRVDDIANYTSCWGIYPSVNPLVYRRFNMLYYPNVISMPTVEINEQLIENTLVPLLEKISNSSWTDEYGVKFANYGREIVGTEHILFRGVKEYTIPNGVDTISSYAFSSTDLEKVTIAPTVARLGSACFADNKRLKSVIFDGYSELQRIPEECFKGCRQLKELVLGSEVAFIDDDAFSSSGLKRIVINEQLQNISPYAFQNTNSLRIDISAESFIQLTTKSHHFELNEPYGD